MGFLNQLNDCIRAVLQPMIGDGEENVKQIVVADHNFNRVVWGESGVYDLPAVGVAYAGVKGVKPLDTAQEIYTGWRKFVVFILVQHLEGVQSETELLDDLVEDVIDNLAGRPAVQVDAASLLPLNGDGEVYAVDDDGWLLDENGERVTVEIDETTTPVGPFDLPDPQPGEYKRIGGKFIYTGDRFVTLPAEAKRNGLHGWAVEFSVFHAFRPVRRGLMLRAAEYDEIYYELDTTIGETGEPATGDDLLKLLYPQEE